MRSIEAWRGGQRDEARMNATADGVEAEAAQWIDDEV